MGATASFNYAAWMLSFPEFSNISQTLAQDLFAEATLYHANDGTGPVQDQAQQQRLLNLVTAHLAFIQVGTAGNLSPGSQGLVGRVSSASEGSVSLSTDLQGMPGNAAFFSQSPYGLRYWQATAGYRTMHYRRGPQRGFGPGYEGQIW